MAQSTQDSIKDPIRDTDYEEGVKVLRDLYGIPISRQLLKHLVKNIDDISSSERKRLNGLIDDIYPEIIDVGCIKLNVRNKEYYILFDDCSRDHEHAKELSKLQLTNPKQIQQINQQINFMVNLIKIRYSEIIKEFPTLIHELDRASDYSIDFDQLQVDVNNCFLYINYDWIDRIGLFVKEI